MKIALTGAHGTGKTTLTGALQKELGGKQVIAVCREVPRVIIGHVGAEDFFRRGQNTLLRQSIILLFQVMEDHMRGARADILICDRTMIDHLAYTLLLFPEFEGQQEFIAVKKAIESWMGTYDHIFRLPIEFAVMDDGVREADVEFQKSVDQKIAQLYREFNITPIVVGGSVGQRMATIKQVLA